MSDIVVITRGAAPLYQLYVQKLALSDGAIAGSPFGGLRGVQVSANTIAPTNREAEVVSDGDGGCVVANIEGTTSAAGRIVAQRLDSDGAALWGSSGVSVTSATQDTKVKSLVRILADGVGGWWVVWLEARAVVNQPEIYAQRLDATGAALLTADGVQVATGAAARTDLRVCLDGSGGIIVASLVSTTVRTQRIDATGAKLWGATEVTVRTGATTPWGEICPDGSGGAFFIVLVSLVLRLLRINSAGASAFTEVPISSQAIPVANFFGIHSDGGSGCIVAWQQGSQVASPRTWTDTAQKFNASGVAQWSPSTGVTAGTSASTSITPQSAWRVEADDAGGIWIAKTNAAGNDVYVTRWSSAGVVQAQDLAVTTLSGGDGTPRLMSDGAGGVVVVWNSDRLAPSSSCTFAQRITSGNVAAWTTDGVLVSGDGSNLGFLLGEEGVSFVALVAPAVVVDDEEDVVMSGTLGTSADNIRWLTGDRNPADYAQKTTTIFQLLIEAAQRLGNMAGLGMSWTSSAFTLVVGSIDDYTLAAGEATNLVAMRIPATGRIIFPIARGDMDQRREGIIAGTAGQGDPQYFSSWESAAQLVTVRIDTVPNVARTVDVLRALNVSTEYLPTSTLPFNESFLRVLEKDVAGQLMLRTTPQERERIGFNPDVLPKWEREVAAGVIAEQERLARIERAPYGVGAVLGR